MGTGEKYDYAYYVVEAIRDKRLRNGETFYLIKWEGYPEQQNTWEPLKNCADIMDMIREFEAKQQPLQQTKVAKTTEENRSFVQSLFESEQGRKPKYPNQSNKENTEPTLTRVHRPGKNYVVDYIVDKLDCRGETFYLIKWKDYPKNSSQVTWEPLKNCAKIMDMIYEFEAKQQPLQQTKVAKTTEENRSFVQSLSESEQGRKPKNPNENNEETTESTHVLVNASNNHRPKVSTESIAINEYTIEKLKKCSSSQIEIVGAEPHDDGKWIGVRALDDYKVFVFDSREVIKLWPKPYIKFMERYIRFDSC